MEQHLSPHTNVILWPDHYERAPAPQADCGQCAVGAHDLHSGTKGRARNLRPPYRPLRRGPVPTHGRASKSAPSTHPRASQPSRCQGIWCIAPSSNTSLPLITQSLTQPQSNAGYRPHPPLWLSGPSQTHRWQPNRQTPLRGASFIFPPHWQVASSPWSLSQQQRL